MLSYHAALLMAYLRPLALTRRRSRFRRHFLFAATIISDAAESFFATDYVIDIYYFHIIDAGRRRWYFRHAMPLPYWCCRGCRHRLKSRFSPCNDFRFFMAAFNIALMPFIYDFRLIPFAIARRCWRFSAIAIAWLLSPPGFFHFAIFADAFLTLPLLPVIDACIIAIIVMLSLYYCHYWYADITLADAASADITPLMPFDIWVYYSDYFSPRRLFHCFDDFLRDAAIFFAAAAFFLSPLFSADAAADAAYFFIFHYFLWYFLIIASFDWYYYWYRCQTAAFAAAVFLSITIFH